MITWRPVKKLNDLHSLEDRLSRDCKLVTAYIPGMGVCYKVVRCKNHPNKRKRHKPVY